MLELLFAAGYAACFHSALQAVARAQKVAIDGSSVGSRVGIGSNGQGGFGLAVELEVNIPGVDPAVAQQLAGRRLPPLVLIHGDLDAVVSFESARASAELWLELLPDGVAVRKVVMWSSNFQEWHEWCQSIEPLHPGQCPEDVLDPRRVLSVANMKGETKTFGWEPGKPSYSLPTIPGANIQLTYLNSQFNPFLILDGRDGKNDKGGNGPAILRVGGDRWSDHVGLPWYDHWPVTQVPLAARPAQAADRPAHTWTSTQASAAYATTSNSMTKIMLCGMTDKPIDALLPLARSWLRPAKLAVESAAFASEGYDPTERAYVLSCRDAASPLPLSLRIDASPASPIVNPAFVVRDWGDRDVEATVDGEPVPRGRRLRRGHRHRIDGTDLVVWLEAASASPLAIVLKPVTRAE